MGTTDKFKKNQKFLPKTFCVTVVSLTSPVAYQTERWGTLKCFSQPFHETPKNYMFLTGNSTRNPNLPCYPSYFCALMSVWRLKQHYQSFFNICKLYDICMIFFIENIAQTLTSPKLFSFSKSVDQNRCYCIFCVLTVSVKWSPGAVFSDYQNCQNIVLFGVKLKVCTCRKRLQQKISSQLTLILFHFGWVYSFMYYYLLFIKIL